jgi:hypothetical protein
MFPSEPHPTWLDALSDEDIAFLKRFVLASGSLKDLAAAYGVTYPTIRIRLDRLLDKINFLDDVKITTDFERALVAMYADGKLDANTMKAILAAHERELQAQEKKSKASTEQKTPNSIPG